jgi:tetratricopeptide (TPR) repeat protein
MAIKGSLREASLADVCQLLALGNKSGCLSVADGSRFGQIYFEKGRITYARIVNRRDRLGDILVREGVLAQRQLEQVLEHQAREPDRRVGELLVSYNYITRSELKHYIRLQIEEAIYHLFTWSRGNFFFEPEATPDEADLVVTINPESLLLEAARRVDEWSLIEKKIPSLDLLFDVDRERVRSSDAPLTAEQQQILTLLDGTRTVQELADQTRLAEFDVGKALFGLIQAGFAHRVGRKAEETVRGREAELAERRNLGVAFYRTGMMDDATREFNRVLELDDRDFAARYLLALIALREKQYRAAVQQMRSLLEERGAHYGAFMNMALALRMLERPADALLVLDEAEAVRPGVATTELARGIALLHTGRYLDARSAFDEYRARLGPGDRPATEYFYYAALNLAAIDQLNEAEALVAQGLDSYTDSAPLLLLLGVISERRGDLENADKSYQQALDEDPSLAQAHKNLGDVAYRRAAHEEALQHYLRAADLEPALGDDVFARIGNIYYKTRNLTAAVEHWKRALRLNPDNAIVRNNLEIAAHASG